MSETRWILEVLGGETGSADARTVEDGGLRDILLRLSSTFGEQVQWTIQLHGVAPPGTPFQEVTSFRCVIHERSCERQALRHLQRAGAERQECPSSYLIDFGRIRH